MNKLQLSLSPSKTAFLLEPYFYSTTLEIIYSPNFFFSFLNRKLNLVSEKYTILNRFIFCQEHTPVFSGSYNTFAFYHMDPLHPLSRLFF